MQGQDADRLKLGDRDYNVVCFQCGRNFEAARSDATFCSPRCRVAFSREPRKLENAIEHMNGLEKMLQKWAIKYSKNKRVYKAMASLRDAINASLTFFESDDA